MVKETYIIQKLTNCKIQFFVPHRKF